MEKLILNIVRVFCAVLCVSAISVAAQDRQTIDFGSVRSVDLAQNGKEGKKFRLSNNQARVFTKQWNHARAIGLCKFYAKYIITIRFENGQTRTFRALEDTLKEEDDHCFVVEDRYIEKVWQ